MAPGLFEAELHCLHRHEWARHADDVLWRRAKLGLHPSAAELAAVAAWCAVHWQPLTTMVDAGPAPARDNAWN